VRDTRKDNTMDKQPKVNSEAQKQLDQVAQKLDAFQEQAREFNPFSGLTNVEAGDPQTKISTREANAQDAIYVKPVRSIKRPQGGKDKATVHWDEKWRAQHDEDWKYVKCIVENNELIGEAVECWTAKWGCDPAHFWKIPVNKPVMIPKLLAEQLSKCQYHRLKMSDNAEKVNYINSQMVADHVVRRIDARPVGFGFV
jgi:hypothetical protein